MAFGAPRTAIGHREPIGAMWRKRSAPRSVRSSTTLSCRAPNVWCPSKSVPVEAVLQFIAYAKANPGRINMDCPRFAFRLPAPATSSLSDDSRHCDNPINPIPETAGGHSLLVCKARRVADKLSGGSSRPKGRSRVAVFPLAASALAHLHYILLNNALALVATSSKTCLGQGSRMLSSRPRSSG